MGPLLTPGAGPQGLALHASADRLISGLSHPVGHRTRSTDAECPLSRRGSKGQIP